MASRLKEDEKNERAIRGLLKQPANRRCINCNSLGPQYVCTTFWTFVCTTCSGIHREFTHRVKSISMAKFTSQEVSSLQEGGNERAKEIYFKELDPHRSVPDSSNVDRLRDFIKHVYEDRRYTGERSSDRSPRLRMADKEEPYDSRRVDSYHSGSRSPPYQDTNERRYRDRASPGYEERRSPGYDRDSQRHSDHGQSPVGSGVVNDWRREDRFANGRNSEDLRSSEGDSRPEGRSPDNRKDMGIISPPVVRPVREILGDSAPALKIIEPPRVNSGNIAGGSSQPTQRTASSSSLESSHGKQSELKKVDSLIDFDADPEPRATASSTQPSQLAPAPSQPVATPTADDNWACFDNVPETKPSQTQANVNPLESMLTQLSVPAPSVSGFPAPSGASTPVPSVSALTPANMVDSLFASPAQAPAPAAFNTTPLSSNNASVSSGSVSGNLSVPVSGLTLSLATNAGAGQLSNMQQPQQSLFPGYNQGVSSRSLTQMPGADVGPTQAGVVGQHIETNAGGRKELPADIFSLYSSYPVAAHGWQTGLTPGMGYPMQYNTAVHMPNFSLPVRSPNPFDAGGAASSAQPNFPSMAPLQSALPNMAAPRGLMGSSFGIAPPSWMPPQPAAYPSVNPQMTPSFGTTAMAPGTYMGQHLPSNFTPSRYPGFGGIGNQAAGFSSVNPPPPTPNQSGNPFG